MSRREKLEEMLKSDPDDVFLQYALAMEVVSAGDLADAQVQLRTLIEKHSDYVPAYFQLAQVLVREDATEEAQIVLRDGIKVAQKVGDAHAEGEMREYLDSLS